MESGSKVQSESKRLSFASVEFRTCFLMRHIHIESSTYKSSKVGHDQLRGCKNRFFKVRSCMKTHCTLFFNGFIDCITELWLAVVQVESEYFRLFYLRQRIHYQYILCMLRVKLKKSCWMIDNMHAKFKLKSFQNFIFHLVRYFGQHV